MLWLAPERLAELPFPAANLPIIKAVQLPEYYAILEGTSVDEVMRNCGLILRGDIRLLQLRVKSLPTHDVPRVVGPVFEACRERGVPLLINSDLPVDSGHARRDSFERSGFADVCQKTGRIRLGGCFLP